MKPILFMTTTLVVALFATPVIAQDAPKFYSDTYPTHALKSALEAQSKLMGKDAKLDPKTRELIALGVSSQIPCAYCIYAHKKFAIAQGATKAEIREAIAMAANVRQWSTVLNGMEYDFEAFVSFLTEDYNQRLKGVFYIIAALKPIISGSLF